MAEHEQVPDNASTAQDAEIDDYPATYRPKKDHLNPSDDFPSFLEHDLSVEKLDDDIAYLWMAGRPMFPRPLSIQRVLNRTIVPTNDTTLHLVWTTGKIFIKVLPPYFLDESFYEKYLKDPEGRSPALGLMYTYVALVPTELDFKLAQDHFLFPPSKELTWPKWKQLARRVIKDHPGKSARPGKSIRDRIPKRYEFGELRLSRLDKIHMFRFGSWTYGYSRLTSTQRYVEFFSRNVGLITASFAWVVIVLTAMQVGLMTDMMKDSSDFQWICSVIAAIAMVLPFAAVAVTLGRFVFIFSAHLIKTSTVLMARKNDRVGREAPPTKAGKRVTDIELV